MPTNRKTSRTTKKAARTAKTPKNKIKNMPKKKPDTSKETATKKRHIRGSTSKGGATLVSGTKEELKKGQEKPIGKNKRRSPSSQKTTGRGTTISRKTLEKGTKRKLKETLRARKADTKARVAKATAKKVARKAVAKTVAKAIPGVGAALTAAEIAVRATGGKKKGGKQAPRMTRKKK